ncbi:hypothetical protein DCE79_05985 [Lysinibacillus sp. 2017]|nr:hypothetical protein DCE79_05985 [Lysinibacillus sp. 2017]
MKVFIKLNSVSVLYALALFISIGLVINVYRISSVTGWHFDVVIIAIFVISLIGLLLSTVLILYIMKKWKISRKTSYWSVIIWFPYFILFYCSFTYLYPLNSGETWFPIFNLLIYGVILLYPIYIYLVILFATSTEEEQ